MGTMRSQVKKLLRAILRKNGHDLVRRFSYVGFDAYEDMAHYVTNSAPLLVDVGGNVGQTVERLKQVFPNGRIHSFEPGPSAFQQLSRNTAGASDVTLWNCGVGAEPGRLSLYENSSTDMSSFLPLGEQGWGQIQREVEVDVVRLDDFAQQNGIDFIDVLKCDTQGFEEAVFRGADRLLSEGRIGLVYFEVTLSGLYEGLPSLDELFRRLVDRGYRLVSIYDLNHQDGLLGWMDAMFVHTDYLAARRARA